MRRIGYDPAFPVSAAWALEFAPVNVSVLFMQRDGNEHLCIGSRSWFFEEIGACIADAREAFPWKAAEHILPPEDEPRVWALAFTDQRLFNTEHAPALPEPKRMLIAQRFLSRLHIDTAPRPWDMDGNNATLLDSLNGYRVKELASHSDVFTMNILGTHEQYLSRALEHYAAWDWRGAKADQWAKAPDFSLHDRAVV
jgi:hypothetical protein